MSSYEPGSRAITIPLHRTATHGRQTRSKPLASTDSADPGPSSLSSRDSSYSSPTNTPALRHKPLRSKAVQRTSTSSTMDIDHADTGKRKDKQAARPQTPPSELRAATAYSAVHNSPLGPSMIASSSYKSINLSSRDDPDEPPRLICYTKHSQGFTWNDELFLPGYLLGRYGGSSRRRRRYGLDADADEDDDDGDVGMMDSNDPERCPVTEIFVTDEEAESFLP